MVEKGASDQINALNVPYLWIVHAVSEKNFLEHRLEVLILRERFRFGVSPSLVLPNLLQMHLRRFFFLKFDVKLMILFTIVRCPLLLPLASFTAVAPVPTDSLLKSAQNSELVKAEHRFDAGIVHTFHILEGRV